MENSKIIVGHKLENSFIDSFYQHQVSLGYAKKNCKNQHRILLEYLYWLEYQTNSLDALSLKTILEYYHYLQTRLNKRDHTLLSPKTIYSHIKILDSFYQYLYQKESIAFNPCTLLLLPYPKPSGEERAILSQQEIKILYQATVNYGERAILSLAYGCGLRSQELEDCNTRDFLFRDKLLVVPQGKGNKRRVVPLSKAVLQDLQTYYLEERAYLTAGRDYRQGETAFMLNQRGGRMRAWTYNHNLKRIIASTQSETLMNKTISIHNLRHSIATHLLEQGVPLEQVRAFLGHSELETTQIYTRVSKEQLNQLIQAP